MSLKKFYKVSSLPMTLEPDSFYYVPVAGTEYVEEYITDNSGVAKQIATTIRINDLIDQKIAAFGSLEIVADITARDALALTANTQVLVQDATADATVDAGAALYVYDHATTSFIKVSEYESLDVVLEWSAIQNRPTSTVADIDDAVNKKHAHTNLPELEKIAENVDGEPTYNGERLNSWEQADW